jgi:hypothetical protein
VFTELPGIFSNYKENELDDNRDELLEWERYPRWLSIKND